MKNFYITTPIYYVNDSPHIGHAYTSLCCDYIARFKKLDGFNVKFLTGTDEHGQKVENAANAKQIEPKDFVDEVSKNFLKLTDILNLSAPGAAKFVNPFALSYNEESSFAFTTSSITSKPTLYDGVFEYGSKIICVLLSLAVNAGLAPQKISLTPYLIASWGTEEYRASSGPLK